MNGNVTNRKDCRVNASRNDDKWWQPYNTDDLIHLQRLLVPCWLTHRFFCFYIFRQLRSLLPFWTLFITSSPHASPCHIPTCSPLNTDKFFKVSFSLSCSKKPSDEKCVGVRTNFSLKLARRVGGCKYFPRLSCLSTWIWTVSSLPRSMNLVKINPHIVITWRANVELNQLHTTCFVFRQILIWQIFL